MLPAICILSTTAVKSLIKVLAKVLFIKSWCCCVYCCCLIAPRVLLRTLFLCSAVNINRKFDVQTGPVICMVSHLVTSELEWPFIFELWPWMPHKWRYNILPFIPSPNQNTLNFALKAFHRNVAQETLSFDLKYEDRLWLTKKVWGLFENILSWFYLCVWFNTFCQGLGKRRLDTDVNRLVAVFGLIQLWPGTKEVKKMEKVWRIIKGKVNKR